MQTVSVRNGVKRKKRTATKKRRNPVTRAVTANPRKRATTVRRKRRNPVRALAVVNPKRKVARKRRNGVAKRNGIFTGIVPVLKAVALGGGGAVATGIASNGIMSVARGVTNNLPVPEYIVKTAVEIGFALVPLKWAAEKIFTKDNSDKIVAGGLIKAGLSFANGALPQVVDYNPLQNANAIIGNGWGALDNTPISTTEDLAGAELYSY